MRFTIFILFFILSGCYLANGSPASVEYWKKNNKKISVSEIKTCQEKSFLLLGNRFKFLRSQFYINDRYYPNKNSIYYDEYRKYSYDARKKMAQCFYDLGYRFSPPLYWCLAQDGDNTNICMENMKYKN